MIYRNENSGIVAGVASGLADSYNFPVWMIRSLFVIGFFLAGIGLAVYLWLWNKSRPRSGQLLGF